MKILPQIYKSIFQKIDSKMIIDSIITMPTNVGIFVGNGSIDVGYISDDKEEILAYSLEENDFIQDNFYYTYKLDKMFEFDSNCYECSLRNGWFMKSTSPNTMIYCLYYNLNYNIPIINNKIDYDVAIKLKQSIVIEKSIDFLFEKNHYMCVIKGTVDVDGITKSQGSWFLSADTKNIKIKNVYPDKPCILLLCE